MILTIRPATRADAGDIGARLRPEDEREVQTITGLPGHEAVPLSFGLSRECYTIRLTTRGRVDRDPTVIFGVADDPTTPGAGIVWLLAAPDIRRAPLSVLREAPYWLTAMGRDYPLGLHNLVDARNDLHVRWLRLTGFTFGSRHLIHGHIFIHAMRTTE